MKKGPILFMCMIALVAFAAWAPDADAFTRYNDGCQDCHGNFTEDFSPKGSVFRGNDKHQMHRAATSMDTNCALCHTSGDNRNPFIGSSDGTANNAGVGCVGCHGREEDAGNDSVSPGRGAGLRQHHNIAEVGSCANCHSDSVPANYTPVGENVSPQYYGTADTEANMPCNPDATSDVNENWTAENPAEFVGLDNDGDGIYDGADPNCAAPECTVDADCDDGLFCNGAETCDTNTGTCVGGTPPSCDDGVACTDDSCDPTLDDCVNTSDDTRCDDNNLCTGDICTEAGCDNPIAVTCDAGFECNPGTGECEQIGDCLSDADCDDGDVCNGTATCDLSTFTCQSVTPPLVCDDGVACTVDTCDAVTGCANTPDNTLCDDNNECTDDICTETGCDNPIAVTCDQGFECNPGTGQCEQIGNCLSDADCDDGDVCNGTATCDLSTFTCQSVTPPLVCDDGVACTVDTCDAVTGCANTPDNTLCDDNNECTDDICTETGCDNPIAVTCNEGFQCNPTTGECETFCTSDADCDDGAFCNGDETCDTGTGACLPGTPPTCDDGVACTDDSCDLALDDCVNTPNDGNCDNGQFCDGAETCDAINDCQEGADPCPGQTCDEESDLCVTPQEADVFLTKLRAPKGLKLGSRTVSKRIVAVGSGDTMAQDAEVTLTAVWGGSVGSVTPEVSLTQSVEPGVNTQFKFVADISCDDGFGRRTGTITWTATISAAQNGDTTNDELTATTNVSCR